MLDNIAVVLADSFVDLYTIRWSTKLSEIIGTIA